MEADEDDDSDSRGTLPPCPSSSLSFLPLMSIGTRSCAARSPSNITQHSTAPCLGAAATDGESPSIAEAAETAPGGHHRVGYHLAADLAVELRRRLEDPPCHRGGWPRPRILHARPRLRRPPPHASNPSPSPGRSRKATMRPAVCVSSIRIPSGGGPRPPRIRNPAPPPGDDDHGRLDRGKVHAPRCARRGAPRRCGGRRGGEKAWVGRGGADRPPAPSPPLLARYGGLRDALLQLRRRPVRRWQPALRAVDPEEEEKEEKIR
ncbi:unnamed protein product [Urochloa humidicola]